MTMRRTALVCAALAVLMPVAAQAMSVADFLAKADALTARGFMAMMSSDVGLLKSEIMNASTAYRTDVTAARTKGQTNLGCPPPKGQARLDSDQLISAFRAIPAQQRATMSVKTALYGYMAKRFPCPATR